MTADDTYLRAAPRGSTACRTACLTGAVCSSTPCAVGWYTGEILLVCEAEYRCKYTATVTSVKKASTDSASSVAPDSRLLPKRHCERGRGQSVEVPNEVPLLAPKIGHLLPCPRGEIEMKAFAQMSNGLRYLLTHHPTPRRCLIEMARSPPPPRVTSASYLHLRIRNSSPYDRERGILRLLRTW